MGVSMLPAHCCPAYFLVFLWDYQPLSVSYVQVSQTNSGLSKLLQHVSTVMQVCVWLRCSQLWRRAFYDLSAWSPSSYFSLSFFSPTVFSLFFSPSPYLLPFFTFQLICPFPWTLSAFSTPSFIPVWLELSVPLLCPPSFPLLLLFSSFLHFWIVPPLFSLSLSAEVHLTAKWSNRKRRRGDGGRVCHFSSFSVICLCLSVGLCFLSPALICSL